MSPLEFADSTSSDWAAATALPRIVDLGDGLFGAAFDVMKTLPAQAIIDDALTKGRIRAGVTVVETTSGTFGLGLAMVCATRGIPLHLVSDPAIDGFLLQRIEDLGATVTVVRTPDVPGGFQSARLREVEALRDHYAEVFIPGQYSNPQNPRAYWKVSALLMETVGMPSVVVGSVGSGGSMCGTVSPLRVLDPRMRAVAVDTHGSVLFGQLDRMRGLRGLGNSLLPPNLDHTVFDEVNWVSEAVAYGSTRELHRHHALYMGPTSGAAYGVARHVRDMTDSPRPVVVILPDSGHRYEDTVHNATWVEERLGGQGETQLLPHTVARPDHGESDWDRLDWARRDLAEVVQSERKSAP